MDFTDDRGVLKLIYEHGKYSVLWDPRDKFYKSNNKKKDAWDAIATVFKINGDILKKKKKMNYVLNYYDTSHH
jgi:hypothetical protein